MLLAHQVYQDVCFPADSLNAALSKCHELFCIYPLLLYPCRVVDRGGMVRVPPSSPADDRAVEGEAKSAMNLNLGVLDMAYPLGFASQLKHLMPRDC